MVSAEKPDAALKATVASAALVSKDIPSTVKIYRTQGGLRFSEGGKDILFYNRDPISGEDGQHKRGHYIHPLYDLDGVLMTHDMPADHLHHRGVFWAWTQLWIDELRIGHPWEQRGLSWNVRHVQILGDESSAAIKTDVLWNSPLWTDKQGKPKPIVEEHSIIRVHEASRNVRLIDFEIRLRAFETNVRLGGSMNSKGYGGFSVRIPLPSDLQIIGPEGPVAVDWRKPSPPQAWVDFSADFGGKGKVSGLSIFCHPRLPAVLQGWTIRKENSCQNPVFPGQHPIVLPTVEPLALHYQIILHRGNVEEAGIAQLFEDYTHSK